MEKVNVDGINIAYDRRGKGVPLILIHGYPLDHTIWDEVALSLTEEFDLIIPDLRGFGESDVMEADDSIIDYATDVAGLLNHLKIKRAYLVGHSMGGYVVLAFAREFPERVSGLGMVSTQTLADTPERKESRLATAKQVLVEGVGIVAESMTPKLSENVRVQDYVRSLIIRQRPLGIYSALNAMAERPDSTELFTTFKFPTVIVHGGADALISVERGREMKAVLPSAHYLELAGLGHMPMMENPQAVADAIRFFVNVKVKSVRLMDK
jgi:pimeloyl-ACP methyl ester carboxylesterase